MDDALDPCGLRPVPGSLAETINHEFRNPLATLLGHLELVADQAGELPADVVASVEAMQRAGLRLTELVAAAADIAEVHESLPELRALVS
jgi:signal transduction histidine kinase